MCRIPNRLRCMWGQETRKEHCKLFSCKVVQEFWHLIWNFQSHFQLLVFLLMKFLDVLTVMNKWIVTKKYKILFHIWQKSRNPIPNLNRENIIEFLLSAYKIARFTVNICQKHLFLHQLTHNMKKDCSLNYEFSMYI